MYCGFNRDNDICRARLDRAGIVAELDAIAATGLEEILLLTGEDRARTDPFYIGEASLPPSASAWWAWRCTP